MTSRLHASAIGIVLLVAGCGASAPPIPGAPSDPPSAAPPSPPPTQTAGALGQPDGGLASWWVDPATLPLLATTRTISGFLREQACASGRSPDGRILDPVIDYRSDAIEVSFTVTERPGGQDCQGNPSFAVEISLSEPLGARVLLDGSETPPRDATKEP